MLAVLTQLATHTAESGPVEASISERHVVHAVPVVPLVVWCARQFANSVAHALLHWLLGVCCDVIVLVNVHVGTHVDASGPTLVCSSVTHSE